MLLLLLLFPLREVGHPLFINAALNLHTVFAAAGGLCYGYLCEHIYNMHWLDTHIACIWWTFTARLLIFEVITSGL